MCKKKKTKRFRSSGLHRHVYQDSKKHFQSFLRWTLTSIDQNYLWEIHAIASFFEIMWSACELFWLAEGFVIFWRRKCKEPTKFTCCTCWLFGCMNFFLYSKSDQLSVSNRNWNKILIHCYDSHHIVSP